MDSPDATVVLALGESPWQVGLGSSLQPARCVSWLTWLLVLVVWESPVQGCAQQQLSSVVGRGVPAASQGQSKNPNAALNMEHKLWKLVHLQKHRRSGKGARVLHKGPKKRKK